MMRIGHHLIIAALLFMPIGHLVAQPGTSGLSFLKLGISGRGVSMADAMSASATGAPATYYNPAGLTGTSGSAQIVIMHREWIQDIRAEFLGAGIRLSENSALGVSINSTTVSDIEIRTRPGASEGSFTARNASFGVSFARRFSDALSIGITGKFLYEKILIDEASGVGFDLGARFRTGIDALVIAGTIANIGGMSALRTEKSKLPSLFRLGGAYSMEIPSITSQLTVASDLLYIFPESRTYPAIGTEMVFNELLAARAGYQFGSKGRGFSTGIGIRYGLLELDYAFTPLLQDLGNGHTISLGISL